MILVWVEEITELLFVGFTLFTQLPTFIAPQIVIDCALLIATSP